MCLEIIFDTQHLVSLFSGKVNKSRYAIFFFAKKKMKYTFLFLFHIDFNWHLSDK